ncbi:MAG TPA: hypothetical protein P5076_17620, partial [Myxococcota bacterium]|nr:hypothetical protein [Myxococcota bacterium]
RVVEVSLYGADPESQAAVSGDGGAFREVLAGIDRLLARGVQVVLKAVLLAPLAGKLDALRALGRARGLEVRLDPGVNRTLDRDDGPTRLRIAAAEAADAELADPGRCAKVRAYDQAWQAQPVAARIAPCAAGFHAFNLGPAGQLMACMLHRVPAFDAAGLGFAAAWRGLGALGRLAFAPSSICATCSLGHLCGYCPAVEALGEEPEYHCEVARQRKRVLESDPAGGK